MWRTTMRAGRSSSPGCRSRISLAGKGSEPPTQKGHATAAGGPTAVAAPDGPAPEQLQQPYRLEESEAVWLEEEPLAQSRICSPARGGHRLTSSSSGGMRATSWLNELIDT